MALTCTALVAAPASADIVKAPTGEKSRIDVSSTTKRALKRQRVKLAALKPASRSGSSVVLPYNLARWDFAARDGDVAHFKRNTGFRLRAGRRSVAVTHPRVVMDSRSRGYVTTLISNVRVKTFTIAGRQAKVTDSPTAQRISGLRLKLTKAGADLVNRALRRRALARFSRFGTLELRLLKPAAAGAPGAGAPGAGSAPGQGTTPGGTLMLASGFGDLLPGASVSPVGPAFAADSNGDGRPDAGVVAFPLRSASFDATSNTGRIALSGGVAITTPDGTSVTLTDPEIVLGTTAASSGLYATVNGARVRVGDIDPSTLAVDVNNGTVNLSGLDATVSGAAAPLLNTLLGTTGIQPGTPLLSLDVSVPER